MQWFYFHYLEIFKFPPEIWRFVTSFLLTGPKLGIVMDTYFIFQYLSQLETTHPKFNRKEDLLWYLVFCGLVIVVCLATSQPFPSLPLKPIALHLVISARIVYYLFSYHGSWKRGRLPLHFDWSFSL